MEWCYGIKEAAVELYSATAFLVHFKAVKEYVLKLQPPEYSDYLPEN